MTTFSKSHQTLIFFTGTLLLWQFVFVLSPHIGVKLVSLGLCLINFSLFLWLSYHPKASSNIHSKPHRLVICAFLSFQFTLSLPLQTSPWVSLASESFELSEEQFKTCFQPSAIRGIHHFSCQLSNQSINFDLPKSTTVLNLQSQKTSIEHQKRYTYTLLDTLLGLPHTQHPTQFQQSQFILSLSPKLADELNLH